MTKNSQEYWNKRARLDKLKVIAIEEQGIDALKRLLSRNLKDVQKKIKAFYDKYGENPAEKLSYSEWLMYKARLKTQAKLNPQDKTLQKLARQNIPKYRIDRLRALEIDLQLQLTEATKGQQAGIYKTLNDVAKVSQATTVTRFKQTLGVTFNKITTNKMRKIISSNWCGKENWSERIWADRDYVGKKVTNILEKGIVQGTSMQKMSKELYDDVSKELGEATQISFNDAYRLIRTESAHVDSEVLLEEFRQARDELGYTEYRYDAFIDNRTSTICQELDNNVYLIDNAEIGVNFPPMHPNCRSTCVLIESSRVEPD